MSLDIFDTAIRNADSEVAHNAAPGLPSTFSENFDSSLRAATEWNNSNNYAFARERALASFYDGVKATTGESLPLYGLGGAVTLDELNAKLTSIPATDPQGGYAPLTEADINTMALKRMAKAHGDAEALAARERTWGGTFGNLAGGVVGALSDPVTQATLPLGGAGEIGVAMRALEFAGIGAGTQAGTAALSYKTREAAVPGSSKEIPGEILSAGLFGAALGGGFGLLGKWLGAGARDLPTSLREDVNAGASEAQFNASNIFPGAAGETANRDAVTSAVQSAVKGERVTAGDTFIEAYHGSPHEFERFDLSKIGTGEGAQAYGHGLYFAENEGVARDYRKALSIKGYASGRPFGSSEDNATYVAAGLIDRLGSREAAVAEAAAKAKARPDTFNDLVASILGSDAEIPSLNSGALYKVRIKADRDHVLDWDKPISEQTAHVQAALKKVADEMIARDPTDTHDIMHAIKADEGADTFYERLADALKTMKKTVPDKNGVYTFDRGHAAASRTLHDAGVPGIKYLDAGSRVEPREAARLQGNVDIYVADYERSPSPYAKERLDAAQKELADYQRKEQTSNFVVFDDKHVQITHKNGQPLTIADARALEIEARLRPLTHDVTPEFETFDRVPGATEDAASYWDRRVAEATPEERAALGATDELPAVHAPDLAPEQTASLAAEPATSEAVQRNLDRLREADITRDYTEAVHQPDGSVQMVTRKLEDVLDEIDGFARAGKELLACATGMMAAE